MRFHLSALRSLSARMKRIAALPSVVVVVTLALLMLVPDGRIIADESKTSVVAALFAVDEDVLSENTDVVVRRASVLSIDQQFDYLANWVLPSTTRMTFRMKATFAQTDPAPTAIAAPAGSSISGIRTPVFSLLSLAQKTNRMDELRRQITAIDDPSEPHELRAKLAMLFMIDIANGKSEAAVESLLQLTTLVKTRGENQAGRWWPETLALAYGMRQKANRIEMFELATSIYDSQIGRSLWSGDTAWDNFVAASHAALIQVSNNESETRSNRCPQHPFENWSSASTVTAKSRGGGCVAESWQPSGNVVSKIAGHNHDYLYFATPIAGDVDTECDVTSFYYRETQLSYAGSYTSHYWTLDEAEIGDIRSKTLVPLDPPMTYPDDWLSSRISVRNGVSRHFLNGRLILERTLSDGEFPWAALRSSRLSHGSIRNVTITGTPEIPTTVRMVTSPKLVGWYSYFDEVVDDPADSFSWLCTPDTDGGFELRHRAAPEFARTQAESLLMYHRPMLEDGVIEYEFYFVPGETVVHPAIDRLTFLLERDGVKTHWVTDRQFQCDDLPPDNRSIETDNRHGRAELSLKANEWNRLQFALKGDVVQIRLNGSTVFEKSIESLNRRQFGLFHFSDESSVRVRNIRWTGDWSKLSENLPRIRLDVAEIETATDELPDLFLHDFRNSNLPDEKFAKRGETITATDEGVLMNVAGAGWTQADVPVMLQISGDFDVRASFRDFHPDPTGRSGVLLVAALDGTGEEMRFSRTQEENSRQQLKIETVVRKPDGQMLSESKWHVCEANDGTLRIVRLGKTLHYLFAENDSTVFRLVGTETIGTEDVKLSGLSVSMMAFMCGSATAHWTDLSVKAENLSGMALRNIDVDIAELNQQRDNLPVSVRYDFEKMAPDNRDFMRWANDGKWNAADKGLMMESEGVEGWVANGLATRQLIDGDFDVTLVLDQLNLAMPTDGRYSGVQFQIQRVLDDRSRIAAIFMRTPTETKVLAQKHHSMPDGNAEFTWHGEFKVESITSLRVARRGKIYTMLARPKDSDRDKLIFEVEHSAGPVQLHCLLHTGAVKKVSKILVKSLEIRAEIYEPAIGADK